MMVFFKESITYIYIKEQSRMVLKKAAFSQSYQRIYLLN